MAVQSITQLSVQPVCNALCKLREKVFLVFRRHLAVVYETGRGVSQLLDAMPKDAPVTDAMIEALIECPILDHPGKSLLVVHLACSNERGAGDARLANYRVKYTPVRGVALLRRVNSAGQRMVQGTKVGGAIAKLNT